MTVASFKPTLASPADLKNLRFPLLGSPKLDGIRATVVGGKLLSRSLKAIPNKSIRAHLEGSLFEGYDGELIVGSPTAKDVYQQSVSGVMRHTGEPNFTFYVFDLWDCEAMGYLARADQLKSIFKSVLAPNSPVIKFVDFVVLNSLEEVLAYESEQIELGYEGIMLRDPRAPYKFGRSTTKEGYLLKVKRFEDSEAEIVGIEEEMFNGNAAQTNELGRTKRSTAKAGLVGKGTMGALKVRDIHHGWEFNIGTGFTADQREQFWTSPPIGQIAKFKYFPVGMKDVPRHPVFLGFRPEGA